MKYISGHHLPLFPNITLYLISNLFNVSTRHPRVDILDALSEHHKYSLALLLLPHWSLASFISTQIHKHNLLPPYLFPSICLSVSSSEIPSLNSYQNEYFTLGEHGLQYSPEPNRRKTQWSQIFTEDTATTLQSSEHLSLSRKCIILTNYLLMLLIISSAF